MRCRRASANFWTRTWTPIRRTKEARIRDYVHNLAPKYRPVLKHKAGAIEMIPPDLSNDELDLELYRLKQQWEAELQDRYRRMLPDRNGAVQELEEHKRELDRFLEEWNE